MKYRVKSSKDNNESSKDNDFEVNNFEIIENTKTRSHLALGSFYICLGFLVSSAVYGLTIDDFSAFRTVFDYVQPIMTTILGYYFGTKDG